MLDFTLNKISLEEPSKCFREQKYSGVNKMPLEFKICPLKSVAGVRQFIKRKLTVDRN